MEMFILFASYLQIFPNSEMHKENVKYELYKQCLQFYW